MRITNNKLAYTLGALLLSSLGVHQAQALSVTQTGTFNTDIDVFEYTLNVPAAQTFDFFTTSYAGGKNLDGSMSAAGGFVPSLTIFSVSTGMVVDCAAAGTTCSGMAMNPTKVDPTTGLANDVNVLESLQAGSYIVAVTEFPNAAVGTFSDGFLASLDPNLFSEACGGTFLEADLASCPQRNGNYSLNIGSVPEPATLWLALPVLVFGFIRRKSILSRS
jgi:hypothetical protein